MAHHNYPPTDVMSQPDMISRWHQGITRRRSSEQTAQRQKLYLDGVIHHSSRCARPIALLVALLVLGLGCTTEKRSLDGSSGQAQPSAAELLTDVFLRYQSATSYRERSQLKLSYETDGQSTTEATQLDIEFARPNRLRLDIMRDDSRVRIVCDGNHLWVSVHDPATDDLRHQVVKRPASPSLTMADIYAASEVLDPENPRGMVSVLMGLPLNLDSSSFGATLSDATQTVLLSRATHVDYLEPLDWNGHPCHRVELRDGERRYVYWIEQPTGLIRRIEFPSSDLFQSLVDDDRPQNIELCLDLTLARLDESPSADFELGRDKNASIVQYFVLPPPLLASSKIGQAIEPLWFESLDGQPTWNREWGPKIQVLIWFDEHSASQYNLAQLARVDDRYHRMTDDVLFRAVCVADAQTFDEPRIGRFMSSCHCSLPVVRDVAAVGRDVLQISEAPTVVVLDRDARVQLFEVGANERIDQAVGIVIDALLKGENVADNVRRHWQSREDQFQAQLQLAKVSSTENELVPATPLPEATPFRKLTAEVAWRSDVAESPSCLEAIIGSTNSPPRLVVVDSLRRIVELGMDGVIVRQQTLDLEETALVSQLKSAIDGRGRLHYCAFTPFGRYVYLLDANFRRLLRYPSENQTHTGILDATLVDLDGDGQLELYVAFADPLGCQRVTLDGDRTWSNRRLPSVLSIAEDWRAPAPRLLAVGESGWILPVGSDGKPSSPVIVGKRPVHQLVSAAPGEGRGTSLLGMSYTIDGRLIAVGLNAALQEQWSYGLPQGVYRQPVRSPIWSSLLGGSWLLAGPDGSIHVIRDDGSFFDQMTVGSEVLGIQGSTVDGEPHLYAATDGQVTCFRLALPARASEP